MKKLLLLIATVAIPFVTFANEPTYRDAKSIKKFVNSLPASVTNNKTGFATPEPRDIPDVYFSKLPSNTKNAYVFLGIKAVSLKDVDKEKLNDVERTLVNNFFDVWAINQRVNGYILVDNTFRIGLASFQGKVIVEPCVGSFINITPDGEIMGFGNTMNSKEYSTPDFMFNGLGNFECVYNTKKNKFIIEKGRYDFIAAFLLDMHKKKGRFQNYLVGKRQENGDMLFGICDTDGKEITPCIYRGIRCKRFVSPVEYDYSLTYTQDELIAKEKARIELLRQQEAERLARQQEWESFTQNLVNGVGNLVGSVYDAATGTTSSSYSSYSSSTTNSSSSKANSNTSSSSSNDGILLQRDRQTYYNWEDQVRKMGTGLTSYNASTLQKAQSAMKNIRTKWEAKGERMYHSEWEDWVK